MLEKHRDTFLREVRISFCCCSRGVRIGQHNASGRLAWQSQGFVTQSTEHKNSKRKAKNAEARQETIAPDVSSCVGDETQSGQRVDAA